jgi:hypothetical protein
VVVFSLSAAVATAADILFVIGDTADLHGGDAVIKHFFERLGHTVMYFDDDEDEVTTEGAAAAADLVYISESVNSEKIKNEITEIETPIIVAEPNCFYEMGMSTVEAARQRPDSVSIRIVNPDHPLAAGYSGNVAVFAEPDESMIIPGPSTAGGDAIVIAKGSGDRQKNADVYFVYDKGAALARPAGDGSGQVAADIRIGFFAASPKAQALLFLQGYDLLEAAVNYALGTTAAVKAGNASCANGGGVTIQEDTVASITIAGSDLDGDPLTYSVVTGPCHGRLDGTAPNLIYTPEANFNGSDNFTFKVNDGTTDSALATVLITVTAVNDPPMANDVGVTIQEDTLVLITLAGSDIDGDPLTYSIVTAPCHGCLDGTAPNLIYKPEANFNGQDSFTFKVNDGTADSNVATVSITVTPVNDPPAAGYDGATTQRDRPVVTVDVLASDANIVSSEPLTKTVVTQDSEGQGRADIAVVNIAIKVKPVSLPPIITLTIADGYDEKGQKKLLANGKAGVVQASDNAWWETEYDSCTSYDFSDVPIPAGAVITSVVIYVEHFEEEQFSSGELQWSIGTGWPSNPVVWASADAPVRKGQCNEAIDSWDVTSFVDTPEKINSLQLQIKNNDNVAKRKTLVDYIYAVVKWY